jgi:hypothetical protein
MVTAVLVLFLYSGLTHIVDAQDAQQSLGPTAGAKRVLGNDQWDVYYFERGNGSFRPDLNYNYLVAKQDLGDSNLTQSERKGLFNRFIQGLGWKDTDFAAVTVKADDGVDLPLLAVQKDANTSLLQPRVGEWRISGLKRLLPGNNLSVRVTLSGGNKVDSTIVANALAATSTVAGVLGAGPGMRTANAIPTPAAMALDKFVSSIKGGTAQAAPAVSIDGIALKRQPSYEFLFFDKPATDSGRRVIAKITIEAKGQPSLFGAVDQNATPSFFNTILHGSLDGKTEREGGVSLYKELQSSTLFNSFASERYEQYYALCDQLPGYLAGQGLVPFDITLAQYAFLQAAKGGGAERPVGYDACPAGPLADEMRRLGFGPLSAETLDARLTDQRKRVRVEQDNLFKKIATAIAQAQGLEDLCQGTVMLWQSVQVFPGVALTKDVARGGDEIQELFSALANGKANTVRMGKFDFGGQGQLAGHATLRVTRNGGTDMDRYRITIVLNSDNQIQRIAVDPTDT